MRHTAFMRMSPSPAPLRHRSATDPPLRCFSVSVDPYLPGICTANIDTVGG
ncbi:hypothetical protein DY000_02040235 [Brassica cretica]|uniref:Uncharacterized protein n=1 Tax=Brassica cretica TaxID=69181 RepID=A0ABQ7BJ35_BRACR|nr:hypothetical protein DY000_02040235 [Brassica cretica]